MRSCAALYMVPVLVALTSGCGEEPEKTGVPGEVTPESSKTPSVAEETSPELDKTITNSIGMKLILISAGEFMMGSEVDEKDRFGNEQQHRVRITRSYYLGVYEVTQGQYEKLMGVRPWSGNRYVKEGSEYPATYVSWEDAMELCRKLSAKEGRKYRLPMEAEWEYACRAGSKSRYYFGDDSSDLGSYAWYDENTVDIGEQYAHQVGLKHANAWGLPWTGMSHNRDLPTANLRRLMAQHGLTVAQVAEQCHLDRRTIRGVLNGTNRPHTRTLHKLAEGLGVSADEFFLPPSRLLHRQFDRQTNPAVDEVVAGHPESFEGWTEADFDELYSRVGTGGGLTVEGALEAARWMNRKRELHEKLDVLLESGLRELVAGMVELASRGTCERGTGSTAQR